MVVLIPLSFFDGAKVANFIELCKYFVRFPLKTLQKGHFLRVVITVSTISGKVCLHTDYTLSRCHAVTFWKFKTHTLSYGCGCMVANDCFYLSNHIEVHKFTIHK